MALTPGTRLGPYEVTAQIGADGMGEVYRATDTNLKRQVAIKVLLESLAADPQRLARFQHEAEVLAALNHPNVAHIHGLERSDGTTALVMEIVEGPTLADRIAQGAIPVDEALPIAKQIAEAAAIAVWATRPTVPDRRETRWRTFPSGPDPARLRSMTVSPDGRSALIVADQAWLWALDSLEARPLGGTEGLGQHAFWSPDSRSIAFATSGALHRIDVGGGPPQTLVRGGTSQDLQGAWNARDVIVFRNAEGGFSRVRRRPLRPARVPAGRGPLPLSRPHRRRQERHLRRVDRRRAGRTGPLADLRRRRRSGGG